VGYALCMTLRALPLLTGLAPLVGINLAYVIGVQADVLPSCVPYIEGCTSISATGRYPPGNMLFRAVMLPQSVLLLMTWYFAALWLKSVRPESRAGKAVLAWGVLGAIALIVYVTFLGTKTPFYEFMRRFGIYFYFIGTVFAQLTLSFAAPPSRWRKWMLRTLALPFVLGLLNFVQKSVLANPDPLENGIEWVVSLLTQLWFLWLYAAWRETGFEVSVVTRR